MSKFLSLDYPSRTAETSVSEISFEFNNSVEEVFAYREYKTTGFLKIKNNQVIAVSDSLKNKLAIRVGDELPSLFANQLCASVQLKKLFLFRKVEARLIDSSNQAFWARLTLDSDKLIIEDIDLEKQFEIDTEDQIEEMERLRNKNQHFLSIYLQ